MADFERFLKDNNLKKIDVANFLHVSKAFITQLCNGSRRLPPDKYALLQAEGWDTSALFEDDQPADISGSITRVGNLIGVSNSPTTVNNGGSAELMKVIDDLREQNRALARQNETLTKIIDNLTAK